MRAHVLSRLAAICYCSPGQCDSELVGWVRRMEVVQFASGNVRVDDLFFKKLLHNVGTHHTTP